MELRLRWDPDTSIRHICGLVHQDNLTLILDHLFDEQILNQLIVLKLQRHVRKMAFTA